MVRKATLYLEWGGDFVLTPNGSMQEATGWDLVRQQIERLVLTNFSTLQPDGTNTIPDNLYEPKYGLGARATIGQLRLPQNLKLMESKIRQALASYSEIAQNPAPVISVTPVTQGIEIYIDVVLADQTPGTVALLATA